MAGQTLSPEELSALAAQHGGLTGAKQGPAKKIPDPDFPGNSRLATEDPNPDIKYTFGDGTYLTAHFDPTAGTSGGWSVTEPGTALKPPKAAAGAAPKTYTDPDTGQVYVIDPTSGIAKPVAGIPAGGQTPADQNADTAAARAKAEAENAAKLAAIAQQRADQLAQNQQATQARLAQNDTSRLGIEQQNANTASLSQQNAAQNTQLQAARDQVDAEYKRIASQVAQGQLTNEQGIARFKEVVDQFQAQRDALNTAMTAGDNAAKYAEMATRNAVGPGFGANFARGLQGVSSADPSKVSYGSGDFTYATPDYQGIAAKATAAALAHLSPFAAQLAAQHQANQGAVGNVAGYRPQPPPDVIGQAAASVVGQQPGYRPAGGGPS